MKKLIFRFRVAIALAAVGWKNPRAFTASVFQTLSGLHLLLLEVANSGKPTMTKISLVVANEKHDLVSVWAGSGAGADPYDRISELRAEIDALKAQLAESISKQSN